MVSRRYITYKFQYSLDDGREQIFSERGYLDQNGDPLTPITPLFLSRVTTDNVKARPKSEFSLRHVLSTILTPDTDTGISEFKSTIPFAPDDPSHRTHIREILELPRVECGDYFGESQ